MWGQGSTRGIEVDIFRCISSNRSSLTAALVSLGWSCGAPFARSIGYLFLGLLWDFVLVSAASFAPPVSMVGVVKLTVWTPVPSAVGLFLSVTHVSPFGRRSWALLPSHRLARFNRTSWKGEREGGRDREKGETHPPEGVSGYITVGEGCTRMTHSHFKVGVPGSSLTEQWITKALGGGRADNTRTHSMSLYPEGQGAFPLSIIWLLYCYRYTRIPKMFCINQKCIRGQILCQAAWVGTKSQNTYDFIKYCIFIN